MSQEHAGRAGSDDGDFCPHDHDPLQLGLTILAVMRQKLPQAGKYAMDAAGE
jgi:hypothetical protein